MMMDEAVSQRYHQIESLAERIQQRLVHEVSKLGFERDLKLHGPDEANYRLEKDPSNGEYSLVGEWRDASNAKLGSLLFHADGSFFVEQDIVRQHPLKSKWFVEAVNAWGRGDQIKVEARLLPMPE